MSRPLTLGDVWDEIERLGRDPRSAQIAVDGWTVDAVGDYAIHLEQGVAVLALGVDDDD